MQTCIKCGHDVSGKKFCPECGTPVVQETQGEVATTSCPRCGGTVRASAAFCMHCGTSLGAQALAAASPPVTVVSQPATRQCIACHAEVPAGSAFCTNCGQSMQPSQAPVEATTGQTFCSGCGTQNHAGARFCNNCGQPLGATTGAPTYTPQTGPYLQPVPQQPYQYAQQPYGQQPYNPGYSPQQQQYAQGGYQQVPPMMGQQPMVLRCPVCMAMAPMGTPNCLSCRTSLAGVQPTPAAAPMQGQQQQQGGLGGLFQGSGGSMAAGALGGAAAVIGGEMLLHGIERDVEHRRHHDEYGNPRGEGVLGELGELGNDLGFF
ncbi:MAG TPA: zinc ribbon domain-containing protein [Ktedonobacteraceae bacterium]|nr:zinc ribbon domain-containing protein [Ktedonobacteraceae bacterium]